LFKRPSESLIDFQTAFAMKEKGMYQTCPFLVYQ